VAKDDHWLCHNGSFDVAVAVEKLWIDQPRRVDDTLFLAFLADPYGNHSLKPAADRYLGMAPVEQDAVRAWLVAAGVAGAKDPKWGAHIGKAPADVVRPYAIGDVVRTKALFDYLLPRITERGMLPAYEREVALSPMLMDNEQQGIPIAKSRLHIDRLKYDGMLAGIEQQIYDGLGMTFNIGSGEELGAALLKAGYTLPTTPTGRPSKSKESIEASIPNVRLKGLLLYRSALVQALSHFLRPWDDTLQQTGESVIHVHWNQVKGASANNIAGGTKTGRMSSEPNFQNLTTGEKRTDLIERVRSLTNLTVDVPEIRSYVEAPKGYTLFGRDYSQQELRLLANFEDGPLQQAYNDNPDLDMHAFVKTLMREKTGKDYPKKRVKNVNFGKIYGAGPGALAAQMGCSIEEAAEIRKAHEQALPSVVELTKLISRIGKIGQCITTIGGRQYFAETESNGKSFEYRLVNYLVQGSAADQTKEAMRQWWRYTEGTDVRFLIQAHDELVGMAPTKEVKRASKRLNECMVDCMPLDVPVRTKGEQGKNWGAMQ
jgi:DNA polymerase I-like protein with 3'-5' exonuclease and polymerase domains